MADLGPNTYPDWHKGSVPSAEEWQRLFSLKLDNDRLISELANALAGASTTDMNALLAALIPDVTAGITASGNIITKAALTAALAGYQPEGDYQPAGNYQPAGEYVTTRPDNLQTAVDILNVETATGTPWIHTVAGQFIRLQPADEYVTTRPDNLQTAVDVLNVETATGTPWIHTVAGQFIRLQTQGNYPEVVGMSGRVVIQQFLATTPRSSQCTVTFPTAFAPGTTPFVICGNVTETGNNLVSLSAVNQNGDGSLQITNTSFNFWRSTGTAASVNGQTVPVLAIGVM